jgi:hypothetical protein
LEICLQICCIHRLGHLINPPGFVALEEPITCPSRIDVRYVVRQRRAHLIGMRACSHAYPCEVCAHRWCTPWRVSGFPLSRVMVRGNFPSTGVSRFLARPVPVPLQSHHGNGFFDVARSSSGWHGSRVSLHARIAPLPLFGSMLSEPPGARQPLSSHVH